MTATTTGTAVRIRAAGRTTAASPLRYPGGKAALASFFEELIEGLEISDPIYVEPYAGGVGAGLALLRREAVTRLVINDIDPAVYAFWLSLVNNADAFVEKVANIDLNVEEWRHQKEIYRTADESDPLSLGFAFFYLNRTNRSGILNAGPIGGVAQTGNYKIDARFNRDQLCERIGEVGRLAPRIQVSNLDGMAVVRKYIGNPNAFLYIDPPYVDMGGSLYLNSFTHRDHADLARTINADSKGNWVVTYDPSDFIRRLYQDHDIREYELHYSAHRATKGRELLISSDSVAQLLGADEQQEIHNEGGPPPLC